MVLESFLWLLLCSVLVSANSIFQPTSVDFKMWREKRTLYSTHSWLWADSQFPTLLQFCFDFFLLRLNKSEKYCHMLESTLWKKSRYVTLSKQGPWATSGTFLMSIIYITLNFMTDVEDSHSLMIYYLCWVNRNMASITMACLWQNSSPTKSLWCLFHGHLECRAESTAPFICLKGSCRAQWTMNTPEEESFPQESYRRILARERSYPLKPKGETLF